MARDPVEEFRRTARVAPDAVPRLVHDLDEDEAADLTRLLQSALDRRHDEITASVDEGMGMIPRPLRGTIKKVLGV